jgi:hypothetical protein
VSNWSRRGVLALGAMGLASACSKDPSKPTASSPISPSGSPTTPVSPSVTETQAASGPSARAWIRLRRHVDGRLALPDDAAYDRVRLVENPRYDANRPLAVLTVASPDDVATAFAFAQDHAVPIAIRSGGHSYPGWSAGGGAGTGVPRSLVLDCRNLDGVRVRADGTATVGAGAALAPVYDALGRRGRAIAGGSCATVGIGGLTLGGGVGVLTRAMGLTCDAVRSMRVVTADGRTRTVDAAQDPDLFWALRGGGGGHLGLVTSFTLTTHVAPTVNTFYLTWPMSSAARVVEAWQSWAPAADARLWSTLKLLGGQKHADGPILLLSGTWTGPTSTLDSHLAGLLDHAPAPSYRSTHVRSYLEAMASYAGCASIPVSQCHTGPGGDLSREAFGATSHVAYSALTGGGISDLLHRVEAAQSSGLLEAGISMDALGGRVRDLDPGATAFVHRQALMTVQYTATFGAGIGSGKAADMYVRDFRSAMTPHWGTHAYVNYADSSIRGYRQAYFGSNAARLGEISRAYDPTGFFTQPQEF